MSGSARIWATVEAHRDFLLLLMLFAVLQLMLLIFFGPGGRFGDYSDLWYYREMAARVDSGYYPYVHYWVEYPPLFPWLPVAAYRLSAILPLAPDPLLWFYVVFGGMMGVFAIGNLALVYLIGLLLYDPARALRCTWFYALLFGPVFVHAGWFDGVPLFFMLLSLYLVLKNRAALGGLAAGLGVMIKIFPLAVIPIAFKLLARRWRYLAGAAVVVLAANLPFYVLNRAMFLASWRALLTQPSWETIWALLDGYTSYGLVTGNRFDPTTAGSGLRFEALPWAAVAIFCMAYLLLWILPWHRKPGARSRPGPGGWPGWVLEQFRRPPLGRDDDTDNIYPSLGFRCAVSLGGGEFLVFWRLGLWGVCLRGGSAHHVHGLKCVTGSRAAWAGCGRRTSGRWSSLSSSCRPAIPPSAPYRTTSKASPDTPPSLDWHAHPKDLDRLTDHTGNRPGVTVVVGNNPDIVAHWLENRYNQLKAIKLKVWREHAQVCHL
jgi:hypothetical protein